MTTQEIADLLIACFKRGNHLYLCGNGGSYDLARHFEEEMLCKFKQDRRPLPALALKAHTSISNDYGFEHVFSRQVAAYGRRGDVLIGISTSGKSQNVNNALAIAAQTNMIAIDFERRGFTTAQIQENQLHLVHTISDLVEQAFLMSKIISQAPARISLFGGG